MAQSTPMVWARRVGIVALVAALAYIVISVWDRDAFIRWMSEMSPIVFFLAMTILPAFGAPQSPFMALAGAVFGVWLGLVVVIAAVALNLLIVYAIAQSKLRPRIIALFSRFGYKVPDFAAGGRKAWRFSATLKLTPALPAFAKAYILAITAVPFPIYFGMSLVITSVFAIAWIALGDSLFDHELDRSTIAAIVIVALALIAVKWWQKRRDISADDALSPA